ncbi:hypothetical protein EG328_008819 [Venturia inaequalis]|uniref:Uncharacterized protein n=1 Tax=Venturia inaequalis TaxID=5025 RepID=A0A8H3UAK3_VENIN|nr:hypothetical protein EG328_008819 [Venturia inaequalis]KAE9979905.1 hypothetical protein EG327_006851 [Venturia inaequalis]
MRISNSSSEDSGTELKESEQEPFLEGNALNNQENGRKGFASKKRWHRLAPVFIGIVTCLCMTTAICSLYELIHRRIVVRVEQVSLGTDTTDFIPSFPLEARLFWNDSDYGPRNHHIQDVNVTDLMKQWKSLMPEGNGWTNTNTSENATQVSVFHQMECLIIILEDFLDTYKGLSVSRSSRRANSEIGLRKTYNCFNYLRQSLMCFADTALEGLDPYAEAENRTSGTLGIGSTHVCRNYQMLKSFADRKDG